MPVAAIAIPSGLGDVPIEAAAVGAALRQALAALVRAPVPDPVNLAFVRLVERETLPPYWRRYYDSDPLIQDQPSGGGFPQS